MERKKKASLSLKNRKSKELAFEKSYDQDESLGIHCSFENKSSPGPEIDIPCTQLVSYDRILEGVVAFVEVRSNTENRFEGISKQMEMLGAKVVKKFTPEVTHVIFKDGKKTTRERALKKGIHLVSVLWVESCRQSEKRVSEDLFPVMKPGEAVTPLIGRLKRTKSMQPKAFEEDVQNSADRGERRRKRKLQAEKLSPSAVIFCLETQDPYSPAAVTSPAITPHMVPDTPCLTLDVLSLSNKALACDVESPQERPKPIEPIKFSEDETDQSPDSSEDIPSSIRKLKKRLLSISTPTRSPSTIQNEPRRTTGVRPEKTPKDVLLTGSEQGKKRKRQESKKLSQWEDIKESVPKQIKKAKCGAQAESNAVDNKKPKVEAACPEKEEWDTSMARDNGSDSVNGANVMKNVLENVNGKTKQANVPKKKKAQAKTNKKFLQENLSNQNGDGEDSESDSVVSPADGNNKASSSNSCSAPSRKKFSKTAKLVGQGDQGEDFGDTNTTEDNEERPIQENKDKTRLGTVKKGHNLKPLNGVSVKRQANQEKLVGQDKHASQEKAVNREKLACQVNEYEEEGKKLTDNYEGKYGNKNRKGKQNEGETRSEGSEEEDNNETCTEEEERHCEGKENRAVKKQRTKLMKKVKPKRSVVMTSMHFNEQDIVLSVVRKLGGFFIEDRVSPSTSHVIAGSPRRTLNVLMAIAKGCWLVSPMWMMKSLEVGYWVDEEPYELSDAFPAAQLCRLERVSAGSGYHQELFVDCPQMYVSENCSPPSDSLMALIRLCGGKVSTSVRKASICIGSMTRRTQAVNITEQWLLDCITQHAVLPFTNYALNSPAKRRRETSPSY